MCSPSTQTPRPSLALVAALFTVTTICLARRRAGTVDVDCPDCEGRSYHHTARTLADPAGERTCSRCRGEGCIAVLACCLCHERAATEVFRGVCYDCLVAHFERGDAHTDIVDFGDRGVVVTLACDDPDCPSCAPFEETLVEQVEEPDRLPWEAATVEFEDALACETLSDAPRYEDPDRVCMSRAL